MKKLLFSLATVALLLGSCGGEKKESTETKKETAVETPAKEAEAPAEKAQEEPASEEAGSEANADQIALGEKLFNEKTCVSCHQVDSKVIGPSIKEIVKVYEEKGGDMLKFLRGENEAIVDTDPGQVAIMKANIEGFVKELSDDEVNALIAYFKHAK